MAGIPLSWADSALSGVTSSGSVILQNGGALSYKSITDTGDTASVVGLGSFSLDHVRISSGEGVRIAGDGDVTISNSYLESTGQGSDHADTIQIYAPGSTGNVTITNTTIVAHNTAATAGMFVADDWSGTLTFNNVVFQGGPFGLRVNADSNDISVSLKDVYFVGPFGYDDLLFQEVNAPIHITQWENVRYATIVNGELVPGALVPPPLPVEGAPSAPSAPEVPAIVSFSDDSGTVGDGITNDDTITLKGTAASNSTVKVFDGAKQIGTVTAASNGAWSLTSAAVADGAHKFTATATSSGVTSNASAVRSITVDTVAPIAPTIAMPTSAATLASTHVTQLTGTAEAKSTVKVFDGATQIGTATANNSGAWTFKTSTLADGGHKFTAKAMDVAGNTGAASAALAVTIAPSTPSAPTGPAAPSIVSFSTDSGKVGDFITNDKTLELKGTAAAGSTVKIFDGGTQIGTTSADSAGNWDYITNVLTDAAHTLTATTTNSSGQTSVKSAGLAVTVDTAAPTAPVVTSDSIVNTNQVVASGTAEAGSQIAVYDGSVVVGTATTNSSGSWSVTTSALLDGAHGLKATATDAAGNASPLSQTFDSVIGGGSTTPPTTTPSGSTGLVHVGNNYFLGSSTGPELKYGGAGVTTGQFQDWIPISSVQVDGGGYDVAWKNSSGQFTFWATDSHGNFQSYPTQGVALAGNSTTVKSYETIFHQDLNGDHTIGVPGATATPTTPTTPASEVNFSSLTESSSNVVTIQGAADAFSQVKMYDGNAHIGTTTAGADGKWSFTSSSAVSNTVHTFKAVEVDSAGHTTASSGSAILGSSRGNILTSTSGNDIIVGNGHPDTFVFAENFGNDVIKDFRASGWGHDTVQFSKSVFDNFADILAHATQAGGDVVIATDHADSLTLKNTKLAALDKSDFHFV